jgi:hypothetical protein
MNLKLNSKTDSHSSYQNSSPLSMDDMNAAEILKFDQDAFTKDMYISSKEKLKSELTINFIKDHGNQNGHLLILEENPNHLFGKM